MVLFITSLHGSCFFLNRVNSWLKDRKERTESDTITIGSDQGSHFAADEMFRHASVLSNDS